MKKFSNDILLFNRFVLNEIGYDTGYFKESLGKKNIIVIGKSKNISQKYFLENPNPFTIKFSFGENEYYNFGDYKLSANKGQFLAIPHRRNYSSYINSKMNEVHSLSIFFSDSFFNSFCKEKYIDKDQLSEKILFHNYKTYSLLNIDS